MKMDRVDRVYTGITLFTLAVLVGMLVVLPFLSTWWVALLTLPMAVGMVIGPMRSIFHAFRKGDWLA